MPEKNPYGFVQKIFIKKYFKFLYTLRRQSGLILVGVKNNSILQNL